ncbi:MAG: hypothetical protein OJF49_004332 [Ktedonobacterales bacterium]|nr:MAG: hypothetical protein OJF49_004332 [Ktedonobacterales bacterium]
MGPVTLPRMPVAHGEEQREHAPHTEVAGTRERMMTYAFVLGLALLAALSNPQVRHWLGEALTTLCVVGGFIAAPFLTLSAWIGLALPESMPLHRASTALFVVALVWMALALIGALFHGQRSTTADE